VSQWFVGIASAFGKYILAPWRVWVCGADNEHKEWSECVVYSIKREQNVLCQKGFPVDQTYNGDSSENDERVRIFDPTCRRRWHNYFSSSHGCIRASLQLCAAPWQPSHEEVTEETLPVESIKSSDSVIWVPPSSQEMGRSPMGKVTMTKSWLLLLSQFRFHKSFLQN
jgi:hypothetical protein